MTSADLPFELRDDDPIDDDQLIDLYASVGWTAYAREPQRLVRALAGSRCWVSAYDGGTLVGLARAIGDGETIAYVQDVLVRPETQRHGVGRALLERLLERLDVRQVVLLTDDEPGQHAFYHSCGLVQAGEVSTGPLHAFVRLR